MSIGHAQRTSGRDGPSIVQDGQLPDAFMERFRVSGTQYVAMSGGVDSSTVAALLHEMGCEVVGISLRLYHPAEDRDSGFDSAPAFGSCCSLDDIAQARRQAHSIGVEHHTLDMVREFNENVFGYFLDEYKNGRTPSPCVHCNDEIKFVKIFDHIKVDSNDRIVTGHYAILRPLESSEDEQEVALYRGVDERKDQSYFLARVPQWALRKSAFPLGELTKPEVRELSAARNLRSAKKPESQDLCFIPGGDTGGFLDQHIDEPTRGQFILPGEIRGPAHKGIHHYTPGQRKGLGIAHADPLYVQQIRENGDVQLATREQLSACEFTVDQLSYINDPVADGDRVAVQVRYRSNAVPATAYYVDGSPSVLRIVLDQPQFAPAPGQLAALYDGKRVIGGGFLRDVAWND